MTLDDPKSHFKRILPKGSFVAKKPRNQGSSFINQGGFLLIYTVLIPLVRFSLRTNSHTTSLISGIRHGSYHLFDGTP
jgi:hypothetical protein